MITFICNREKKTVDCPGGLPVLDWIRDQHDLTGTKEGCREGDCGACTVVLGKLTPEGVDYHAVCSCLLPMSALHGCHLVTIEGISSGDELTPFQNEFYEQASSQCGFCTPGMLMSLTGFLLGRRDLSVENAMESLDGNICRCTGYASVRRAVENVMGSMPAVSGNRLDMLIENGHVPCYFKTVPGLLDGIEAREAAPGQTLTAGGTDLYVHPGEDMLSEEPVLTSGLSDSVKLSGSTVVVGAAATVETIRESEVFRKLFPEIDRFFRRISSTQIRFRATVGGNIMNGSPIADLAVLFLALGATVHTKRKQIDLCDLYLGYKEFALEKGELLTRITFTVPPENSSLSALKVCKREHLDIASVNSAALITLDGGTVLKASLSAGGVAPFPLLLRKTSDFLAGKKLTEEVITVAGNTAVSESAPISDIRGSREYKAELLRSQIRAHLTGEGNR